MKKYDLLTRAFVLVSVFGLILMPACQPTAVPLPTRTLATSLLSTPGPTVTPAQAALTSTPPPTTGPLNTFSPDDGTGSPSLTLVPNTCITAAIASEPAYKDPTVCLEDRVEDLLQRMNLAEKVGQMTQVEKNSIDPADIAPLGIGSILSGGGGYPTPNTPWNWSQMTDGFQKQALNSRLGIPILYGSDAVHGHNNVKGAVIFPHNIGLGAANDPELMERIGRITAVEMTATGVHWNFGPAVTVPQDIRWGRTYEGYGENTALVSRLAVPYLYGLQTLGTGPGQGLGAPGTVLATAKHFVGDGGTHYRSSAVGLLDQGDTRVDEAVLRSVHLQPYIDAVEAGTLAIMVSFSSWNGTKMHANSYLLNEVLKGELGFEGFLVSDWKAIDQISPNYYEAVVTAINAGIDMNMVPYEYQKFIDTLSYAIEKGDVSLSRIDDAVRRILRVKFSLGLFERPFSDPSLLPQVGSDEHREAAREAVRKSMVLLKNENQTLPLPKDIPRIYIAGRAADDIAIQSGGWTIEWAPQPGLITRGTTILKAIRNNTALGSIVEYDPAGGFERFRDEAGNRILAEVGIAVVGEIPYAEYLGDEARPALSVTDIQVINRVRAASHKLVVIVISGRPIELTEQLPVMDALVAAWLPGTEAQGVADVLLGEYDFQGRLPYTWPRWNSQLPFNFSNLRSGGCDSPLFPAGYGLTYADPHPIEFYMCPRPSR